MTPDELATAWVPVPLRWRHVIAGDTFADRDGALWHVTMAGDLWRRGSLSVSAIKGEFPMDAQVDPDDVIPVLIPVTERDAVELTIDQLGARLVARRTTLPSEVPRNQ
jgi:hypothetical protein